MSRFEQFTQAERRAIEGALRERQFALRCDYSRRKSSDYDLVGELYNEVKSRVANEDCDVCHGTGIDESKPCGFCEAGKKRQTEQG